MMFRRRRRRLAQELEAMWGRVWKLEGEVRALKEAVEVRTRTDEVVERMLTEMKEPAARACAAGPDVHEKEMQDHDDTDR